jgi:hypothetical protein
MSKAIRKMAFAVIVFSLVFGAVTALAISDTEFSRIEALLAALDQSQDIQFIRNGKAYNSKRAVSHLNRKLRSVKDKLTSAEQFIDEVASGSSVSGDPYLVRYPDGSEILSRDFFYQLLKKLNI